MEVKLIYDFTFFFQQMTICLLFYFRIQFYTLPYPFQKYSTLCLCFPCLLQKVRNYLKFGLQNFLTQQNRNMIILYLKKQNIMEADLIDFEKLTEFYAQQNVRSFIAKQIQQIFPVKVTFYTSFIGLEVHFPNKTQNYCFETLTDDIKFLIMIGKAYPVLPPRIHLLTELTEPGFNDCRDLVKDIMPKIQNQQYWSHRISLRQICQKIQFFLKAVKKTEDIYEIVTVGKFYLNHIYPMKSLKEFENANTYLCFLCREENLTMNVIYLTQTHLLLFETKDQPNFKTEKHNIPNQQQIEELVLVFYAQLGSLHQIKINRQCLTEVELNFVCMKPRNLQLTQQKITKKLKVIKNSDLLVKLIKGIKKYEPTQIKLNICIQNCEKEQTQLLQSIFAYEEYVNCHLNKESIKQINKYYQMGVQFYSGKNLPYYEIFLDKIIKFNQRPDVKLIVQTDS